MVERRQGPQLSPQLRLTEQLLEAKRVLLSPSIDAVDDPLAREKRDWAERTMCNAVDEAYRTRGCDVGRMMTEVDRKLMEGQQK